MDSKGGGLVATNAKTSEKITITLDRTAVEFIDDLSVITVLGRTRGQVVQSIVLRWLDENHTNALEEIIRKTDARTKARKLKSDIDRNRPKTRSPKSSPTQEN